MFAQKQPVVYDSITLGIDASNIRAGGGLTHLSCLLQAFKPSVNGILRVIVWGGKCTIDKLPSSEGVELLHVPMLDRALPIRMIWQRWMLPGCLHKRKCDILLSPGGILPICSHVPAVVISQNLLPFEPQESRRFAPWSFMRLKMKLVGIQQRRSMEQADGLVFLTRYAQNTVLPVLRRYSNQIAVIPHGIEPRFFRDPQKALSVSVFTHKRPFRLLYVSIIDVYKHQWHVAKAVAALRDRGLSVEIDFVGPAYGPALKYFVGVIEQLDPAGEYLHYRGAVSFNKLHSAYMDADSFIFASSCENLPNILLEAMAAGLPIACSRKGPMPEVLKNCGVYFDPERPEEIEDALLQLFQNPNLRQQLALCAFKSAKEYSWNRCVVETFDFITQVAHKSKISGKALQ